MNRKEEIDKASYEYTGEYTNSDFHFGAEWADETMIERICNYLKSKTYQEYPGGPFVRLFDDSLIEDLKNNIRN